MAKIYKCMLSGRDIEKEEAFRFVLSPDGDVCLDLNFKLSGKSSIISRDPSLIPRWCDDSFFKDHFEVDVDIDDILARILRQFHHKILTFIALAKKSGRVHLGKKQVEHALKHIKSEDFIIIQAKDASEREKFKNNDILELFSSTELSEFLGKEKLLYLLVVGDFVCKIKNLTKTYKYLMSRNDR